MDFNISPKYTKIYNLYHKGDQIQDFFTNKSYAHLHNINYIEFLQIFGQKNSTSHLGDLNIQMHRIHNEYSNAYYNMSWKYKYVPLILRSVYCLGN